MPVLRDLILAKGLPANVKRVAVPCPELFEGTDVSDQNLYVRGMTVAECDRWDLMKAEQRKKNGIQGARYSRALPVIFCTSDKDGNAIFAEEDLDAVNALPIAPVNRLYWKIYALSGRGGDEPESARTWTITHTA
jgi:hypothetical protein